MSDYETGLLRNGREVLLPGDSSLFDWQGRDARLPGIFAQADGPRLSRSDFVANSDDSHWLSNPAAPLGGFSALFGDDPAELRVLPRALISARTRMGLKLLTETGANGASGADGRFSFDELSAVPFNNRALMAEVLRDAVAARCTARSTIEGNGKTVDLGAACAALAAWDLRVDAGSPGAALWRAFLSNFYNAALGAVGLFADAPDTSDPIATPRTLVAESPEDDTVLAALAAAADRLREAGVTETATLGELQFTQRRDQRVPLHGGFPCEGAFNIVGYQAEDGTLLPGQTRGVVLDALGLTVEGYPIDAGSSFMLVTSFTDQGPVARSLLSYSQSADPDSPHYGDQTQLFAQKQWRDVRFREDQIRADPQLREETVSGPRPGP